MFLSKILTSLTGGAFSGSNLDGLFVFDDSGALWVRLYGGSSAEPVRTNVTGSALAASYVLKSSPGTFISAACEVDPSAPTATYYLMLLDAASVPTDGAVTVLASLAVDHTNGTRDYPQLSAEQGGIACTAGLVLVLSTTRPSKTAAGSYLWLDGASVS
jgi:hypothetical protein